MSLFYKIKEKKLIFSSVLRNITDKTDSHIRILTPVNFTKFNNWYFIVYSLDYRRNKMECSIFNTNFNIFREEKIFNENIKVYPIRNDARIIFAKDIHHGIFIGKIKDFRFYHKNYVDYKFANKICQKCYDTCGTCSGNSKFSCLTCKNKSFIN